MRKLATTSAGDLRLILVRVAENLDALARDVEKLPGKQRPAHERSLKAPLTARADIRLSERPRLAPSAVAKSERGVA